MLASASARFGRRTGVVRRRVGRPPATPAARNRALERAVRWLSWTAIVAGAALLAFVAGARLHSHFASRSGLDRFEEARAARQATAAPAPSPRRAAALASIAFPDRSLWAPKRIAAYEASLAQDVGLPLAVLRIPRLGLEVPVWSGTDELTLNRGLGAIAGSAVPGDPGNVGIAGHRDGFFRILKDIADGDRIELETLAGTEHFVVEKTLVVRPEDVWVLDPTPEPSLTLVTCYPFYYSGSAPERFIVRAVRRRAEASAFGSAR